MGKKSMSAALKDANQKVEKLQRYPMWRTNWIFRGVIYDFRMEAVKARASEVVYEATLVFTGNEEMAKNARYSFTSGIWTQAKLLQAIKDGSYI